MPQAAFELYKYIGFGAGTESLVNSNAAAFLSADLNTVDSVNYPIAIPKNAVVPDNYSYESWFRLKCSVAPVGEVSNIKFYGPNKQPDNPDGTNPSPKLTVYVGTVVSASTPTDQASSVANVTQHDNYFGPDAGDFLPIGTPQTDDKITAVNHYTDYFVLQLRVKFGAPAGNINLQLYTIEYDET